MNKQVKLAALAGITVLGLIAAPTAASFVKDFGTMTQTVNFATFDVEALNGLGTHQNFMPGQTIKADKITLKNNSAFTVEYTIDLTHNNDAAVMAYINHAVTGVEGITREGNTYKVSLAPNTTQEIFSEIAFVDGDIPADVVAGKTITFDYSIVARQASVEAPTQEIFSGLTVGTNPNLDVSFTTTQAINLGLAQKGNVVVKYLDANGTVLKTKAKHWDGYLNNAAGEKFGLTNPQLPAGTYSTTFGADNANVAQIEVTVTNDAGVSQTETVSVAGEPTQPAIFTNFTQDVSEFVAIQFTTTEAMNIGMFKKANVVIEYIDANGTVVKSKAKHWDGYLNNAAGEKFGLTNPQLPAGTYSTVLTDVAKAEVATVRLTVTNDEGTVQTAELAVK